ncbi:MAG: general secretion pathway protein GspB [Pseudomonadota bacterium]
MSYILDALRKADSERERGSVPTIHSQSVPSTQPESDPSPPLASSAKPWMWGLAGAGAVLLAGALVWVLVGGEPASSVPTVRLAVAVPEVIPPPPLPSPMPTPVPEPHEVVVPQAAPSPAPVPTPTPTPGPDPMPQARQQPPPALVSPPTRAAAPVRLPPPAVVVPQRQPGASVSPQAPQAPDERVYAMHELPEAIKRSLPVLTIGGAMYSETPSSRMLILNGQVFHEGDSPGPELVLEQIKLKSAVLKYKGYRSGINY